MAEYFRRFPPVYAWPGLPQNTWIVECDGKATGLASVSEVDAWGKKCSIGFLLEPEARGQHFPWLVRELGNYVFDYLGMNKAYCLTLSARAGLHKNLEEAGLTREATLRSNIYWRGQYHDEILHSLTAAEYRRLSGT